MSLNYKHELVTMEPIQNSIGATRCGVVTCNIEALGTRAREKVTKLAKAIGAIIADRILPVLSSCDAPNAARATSLLTASLRTAHLHA